MIQYILGFFFILLKICSDHRIQCPFFGDIQNIDYTGKTSTSNDDIIVMASEARSEQDPFLESGYV